MTTSADKSDTGSKPAPPFTLSLMIGKVEYVVTRLDADPSIAARAFRLQKMDGTTYDLRQDDRGRCECECKGFLRWSGRAECKHIKTLRAAGLFVPLRGKKASAPAPTLFREGEAPAEPKD